MQPASLHFQTFPDQRSDPDLEDDDSFDDDHIDLEPTNPYTSPNDLSTVPNELLTYPGDSIDQSTILYDITRSRNPIGQSSKDRFIKTRLTSLKLSKLRDYYDHQDESAVNLLATRHKLIIDDDMLVELGNSKASINTDESMIDYHMTVANSIGFSSLLSNANSDHRFEFNLDLHKPYVPFKGKYAMLGFDPAGSMLYIGRCNNEDVFLAMAPNSFLTGRSPILPPGFSSASPLMSRRHYRQIIMLFAYLLSRLSASSYYNVDSIYDQDLDSPIPRFADITNIMSVNLIRINFELLTELDSLIVNKYREWVDDAPDLWKLDGFLNRHSPIIVTSRFGQNARVAIPGNEAQEAAAWSKERDYSKLAFFTFAIATSITYAEIEHWSLVPPTAIIEQNPNGLFDHHDPDLREPIEDLHTHPLLDENDQEIPIYDSRGDSIPRRLPVVDMDAPPCGVLVDLDNIEALFDPCLSSHHPDHDDDDDGVSSLSSDSSRPSSSRVQVHVYPLAFLKSIGNVQANGIPPCFYPFINKINDTVGKKVNPEPRPSSPSHSDDGLSTDDERHASNSNPGPSSTRVPSSRALKPVSAQFYNYVAHRIATRAGAHDSQQGTVTAAIAGAFADSQKDKDNASTKQSYCNVSLPADRFHTKISVERSPSCCRAELVYALDIRALKNPSGRSIFTDVILPLSRSWKSSKVRDIIKNYIIVLKPGIFPALFDWVAYPVTLLIKSLYESGMLSIQNGDLSCSFKFRLELLAALERTLCFCHTGSTAALATSFMHPLGLSRGIMADGFPMFDSRIFKKLSILSAMRSGFQMDMRHWPLKDGYPAIASKKAQILTYSLEHFMAYQAKLRIEYLSYISSESSDPEDKAFAICKIAFDAFFQDTRLLVARGVRADIALRKATASAPDNVSQVDVRPCNREKSLCDWLKFEYPLAYGHETPDDVFNTLVRAVRGDDDLTPGLPNWETFATNRTDLAKSFYKMSLPNSPSPPTAPVLRKGSFLPVLKVAHGFLIAHFDDLDRDTQKNAILRVLKRSFHHFKVNFFPAPKPRTGTRGAPNSKPCFDSWGNLGKRDTFNLSLDRPFPGPDRARDDGSTGSAYKIATKDDCNAPWKAIGLNLTTLCSVLKKTSLPEDFLDLPLSKNKEVDETYAWVKKYYNGAKPLHHLAILIAIVVTSTLLPKLFTPSVEKSMFENADKETVRKLYEEVGWSDKDKTKGQKDKKIFLVMITTFIIAIYEENSPIRRVMDNNPKNGFSDQWRSKHSVKGISYITLIRLGVVWGLGTGAVERGKFGLTWGCHSPEDIQAMYRTLCKRLSDRPYGPFDALSLLIGDKNALAFSQTLQKKNVPIMIRPSVQNSA